VEKSSDKADLSMAALQAATKGTVMTEYHGFKFSDRLTAIKLICARDAAAVLDEAHDMAGESDAAAGGGMANSPLASSRVPQESPRAAREALLVFSGGSGR
jgi:hypothetical protein